MSESTISHNCSHCNKKYEQRIKYYHNSLKRGQEKFYCSKECCDQSQITRQEVICFQCNKNFFKRLSQIKKTKNNFCCKSCAATYNNTHKTTGTRVSKLEVWLAEQLLLLYPELEFHFNRKDAINSELDIYIPSMKLAFELNGIFHYEPIFGEAKLSQINNNDQRKFQACLENNIELCLIDTSKQKYFKAKSSQVYFDIIKDVIDSK